MKKIPILASLIAFKEEIIPQLRGRVHCNNWYIVKDTGILTSAVRYPQLSAYLETRKAVYR
jgi:hypothetical protein